MKRSLPIIALVAVALLVPGACASPQGALETSWQEAPTRWTLVGARPRATAEGTRPARGVGGGGRRPSG